MERVQQIRSVDEKLVSQLRGFRPSGSLEVRSPAFQAGGPLPKRYTMEGENLSPPVIWIGLPPETEEVVLICEDPNSPSQEAFVHWIVHGLRPDQIIPEGVEHGVAPPELEGAFQGKNSKGEIGYTGAMPPRGHGLHHYHFQVFAINKRLNITEPIDRDSLVRAMAGYAIGCGVFIGTYER